MTVSTAARISGGRVTVSMAEFRFKPKALVATAGKLRVTAKNDGREEHEFVLIRTNKRASALPMITGHAFDRLAIFVAKRHHRPARWGRWKLRSPARAGLITLTGTVLAPRPNRPWRPLPNAVR